MVYAKHEIAFKRGKSDLQLVCPTYIVESDGWLVPPGSCETLENTCQTGQKRIAERWCLSEPVHEHPEWRYWSEISLLLKIKGGEWRLQPFQKVLQRKPVLSVETWWVLLMMMGCWNSYPSLYSQYEIQVFFLLLFLSDMPPFDLPTQSAEIIVAMPNNRDTASLNSQQSPFQLLRPYSIIGFAFVPPLYHASQTNNL